MTIKYVVKGISSGQYLADHIGHGKFGHDSDLQNAFLFNEENAIKAATRGSYEIYTAKLNGTKVELLKKTNLADVTRYVILKLDSGDDVSKDRYLSKSGPSYINPYYGEKTVDTAYKFKTLQETSNFIGISDGNYKIYSLKLNSAASNGTVIKDSIELAQCIDNDMKIEKPFYTVYSGNKKDYFHQGKEEVIKYSSLEEAEAAIKDSELGRYDIYKCHSSGTGLFMTLNTEEKTVYFIENDKNEYLSTYNEYFKDINKGFKFASEKYASDFSKKYCLGNFQIVSAQINKVTGQIVEGSKTTEVYCVNKILDTKIDLTNYPIVKDESEEKNVYLILNEDNEYLTNGVCFIRDNARANQYKSLGEAREYFKKAPIGNEYKIVSATVKDSKIVQRSEKFVEFDNRPYYVALDFKSNDFVGANDTREFYLVDALKFSSIEELKKHCSYLEKYKIQKTTRLNVASLTTVESVTNDLTVSAPVVELSGNLTLTATIPQEHLDKITASGIAYLKNEQSWAFTNSPISYQMCRDNPIAECKTEMIKPIHFIIKKVGEEKFVHADDYCALSWFATRTTPSIIKRWKSKSDAIKWLSEKCTNFKTDITKFEICAVEENNKTIDFNNLKIVYTFIEKPYKIYFIKSKIKNEYLAISGGEHELEYRKSHNLKSLNAFTPVIMGAGEGYGDTPEKVFNWLEARCKEEDQNVEDFDIIAIDSSNDYDDDSNAEIISTKAFMKPKKEVMNGYVVRHKQAKTMWQRLPIQNDSPNNTDELENAYLFSSVVDAKNALIKKYRTDKDSIYYESWEVCSVIGEFITHMPELTEEKKEEVFVIRDKANNKIVNNASLLNGKVNIEYNKNTFQVAHFLTLKAATTYLKHYTDNIVKDNTFEICTIEKRSLDKLPSRFDMDTIKSAKLETQDFKKREAYVIPAVERNYILGHVENSDVSDIFIINHNNESYSFTEKKEQASKFTKEEAESFKKRKSLSTKVIDVSEPKKQFVISGIVNGETLYWASYKQWYGEQSKAKLFSSYQEAKQLYEKENIEGGMITEIDVFENKDIKNAENVQYFWVAKSWADEVVKECIQSWAKSASVIKFESEAKACEDAKYDTCNLYKINLDTFEYQNLAKENNIVYIWIANFATDETIKSHLKGWIDSPGAFKYVSEKEALASNKNNFNKLYKINTRTLEYENVNVLKKETFKYMWIGKSHPDSTIKQNMKNWIKNAVSFNSEKEAEAVSAYQCNLYKINVDTLEFENISLAKMLDDFTVYKILTREEAKDCKAKLTKTDLKKFIDEEEKRAKELSGVDDKTAFANITFSDETNLITDAIFAADHICKSGKYSNIYNHLSYVRLQKNLGLAEKFGAESKLKLRQMLGFDLDKKEKLHQPIDNTEASVEKYRITDDIKTSISKAKWRVAQRQLMKRIKAGVMKLCKQNGSSSKELQLAANFFETRFGEGLLSSMIGFGGQHISKFNNDENYNQLMDEFKVEGVASIGDDIVNRITNSLYESLNPIKEDVRIGTIAENQNNEEEEVEEIIMEELRLTT